MRSGITPGSSTSMAATASPRASAPSRQRRRVSVPAVSSGAGWRRRWATIGPASNLGAARCRVMPASAAPSAMVQ